jgi:FtsZ-interacting cell division protein ZipA
MNNYVDPYEQMLLDDFRHNIMEGRITTTTLRQMIAENKLSDNQLRVIEELAPFLGGVANVAKSAYNGVKNIGTNIKNSYNQGKQQAVMKNSVGEILKAFGALSKAVNQLQTVTGEDYSSLLNYTQQWSNYAKSLVNPQQQQPQQQQQVAQPQQTAQPQQQQQQQNPAVAPNTATSTQAQPQQRRKQPVSRKKMRPVAKSQAQPQRVS